MKLQIELWAEKIKPFGEEAEHLFKESVLCYKVGAYTSAFLMSYLAFRTTVRYRILKCTYRPAKYTNDQMWNFNISTPLKSDDSWEEALDKILEASADNIKAIIYFENRDKALNELKYWRGIRNDCAHARKATISSSTVESFWNYLIDNMAKFYVLGGREYLVEKMIDNYNYHKIDEEGSGERALLIHDLKIVYDEPAEFFDEFFTKLGQNDIKYLRNMHNNIDFWKDFIDTEYEEIQVGIVKELMKVDETFYAFYSEFPKILELAMNIDPRFTRDVLSEWLAVFDPYFTRCSNQIFWNILCTALERNKESINIMNVTRKIELELIEEITLNERQIMLLNECDFFNQSVLSSGSYFFVVDYDSILRNRGRKELVVLQWFNYVRWDITLLEKLDSALNALNQRIQKLSGKHYGTMELDRRSYYKKIIETNKDKILENPEQLDSLEHIKQVIQ
ncbi:hypothetical protein P4H67_25745 [Paenibacillus lautus]|uniref:hypothetical protein n=1 Tax=Paenibacillus lautus TaxID=1401 RepID=UPI002DBFC249|nr:hypothetical protein [Paenibacillus lautus]MEC0310162.1 hypothetical protein [Paenibacillus lautus]